MGKSSPKLFHGPSQAVSPGIRRRILSLFAAVAIQVLLAHRGKAENHFDYRFEDYQEEKDRIQVLTHAFLFEQSLGSLLSLKGSYVRDAVSGASPTGAPPPAGSSQVPLAYMSDVRNAGFLEGSFHYGRHTTTPQISYSLENDYESEGISLTHAIDFNQKNTVLSLGYAHTYDTIMPEFWNGDKQYKNSDDFLLSVTQLLSPRAYVMAAVTFGEAHGYLADPYKSVRFDGYPVPDATFPERRPGYRSKQIGYVSGAYHIDAVQAGVEASYRLYHDSYEIWSHTVAVAWHQKIARHFVISPLFRFTDQSAASFYGVRFPGDPSDPSSPVPIPDYYSADYRLSSLSTYTYGLNATVKIKDRVSLDAGYERYVMYGNDGVTSASAYPKANVFRVGARLWW